MTLTLFITLTFCEAFAYEHVSPRKRPDNIFNAFSSDGCSAYPDKNHFFGENKWSHCCLAHDMAYYIGGTFEEKERADEELSQCVAEESFPLHGQLMKLGVTIGGTPKINTSWRWGYGWYRPVDYKEYSHIEMNKISEKMPTILDYLEENSDLFDAEQINYVLDAFNKISDDVHFKKNAKDHFYRVY